MENKQLKQEDIKYLSKYIRSRYTSDNYYPCDKVKTYLGGLYTENSINVKPKANQLKNWFIIEETTHRINGITTRCIYISGLKFIK